MKLKRRLFPHALWFLILHISIPFFLIDDKTRVALGDNQDYINASYIRMQFGAEEFFYISCQGPLITTVSAFWQMIWENKSDVIAMMTQEVERGRVKCQKYWPEKHGVPLDTGMYKVHLDNLQYLENFHIKVIRMVETEVSRPAELHRILSIYLISHITHRDLNQRRKKKGKLNFKHK